MAANSEAKGLAQIVGNSVTHAQLSGNSSCYYWTTQTTATNTTALTHGLMQDTMDCIKDMKEQINRQIYGTYTESDIDYSDHIVRKGIRELPNKLDIFKLM